MSTLISDYLRSEREKPYIAGKTDCCTTADRWAEIRLGYSPLKRYGRTIDDEASLEGWLSEPGSLPVAVNRVMRRCGIKKTTTPTQGDIGIVICLGMACMAVFDGKLWHSRNENGFIAANECWKAWSLSKCP